MSTDGKVARERARRRAHEVLGFQPPDSPGHSAEAGEYAGVKFGPKTDLHFSEKTRGQCDRLTAAFLDDAGWRAALEDRLRIERAVVEKVQAERDAWAAKCGALEAALQRIAKPIEPDDDGGPVCDTCQRRIDPHDRIARSCEDECPGFIARAALATPTPVPPEGGTP